MKKRHVALAISAAVAGGVAVHALRQKLSLDLRGKVVLITGGSRGLGLATAREFGRRGAVVAICARDGSELERAKADLGTRGIQAHTFVCDVTDRKQVDAMIQELGPVDILVNNAGIIQVGPISAMEYQDFDQAMNVMFWGPLHVTLAVLPAMRERGHGRIVNITSIAGKISMPHMVPYSCAKFALVALSDGLRGELAHTGVKVTTVVPGLMRTGSHLNAQFKGHQSEEYAWFATAAATPFISVSAERAARAIVNAAVTGQSQKIISLSADLLTRVHGLSPGFTAEVMNLANRFLPREAVSLEVRSGRAMEAEWNSKFWRMLTASGSRAADELNER